MPIEIFKKDISEAEFINRPNRFVVKCLLKGKEIDAYLPNPGRLYELLLQGVRLYLIKTESDKMAYRAIAVLKDSFPVMIDTHANNLALKELLQRGLVKGLKKCDMLQQEIRVGQSRFDFLLTQGKSHHYIEAKSCTLFGQSIAMFPDAVTERGTRHLKELIQLSERGHKCHVIFLVHSPKVSYFMPEYHTDLAFSRAFLNASNYIDLQAIGITWNKELQVLDNVSNLTIPFTYLKKEIKDTGGYLIILEVLKDKTIRIGALGDLNFKKGYYIYVGSAMNDLTKRIARHRKKLKNIFWHIDYLLKESRFVTVLPVRSSDKIECLIAHKMSEICDYAIDDFGCSDCDCKSHLFFMKQLPLIERKFIDRVIWLRIDRLMDRIDS